MTSAISETLDQRQASDALKSAYKLVVDRLDPEGAPNVEAVYQAVVALATRGVDVRDRFVNWIREVTDLDREERLFLSLADVMRQCLVTLTLIEEDERVRYYQPLVKAAFVTRTPIFTLNFDNAVELAADLSSVPVDTGLSKWDDESRLFFDEEKLELIKLHGSVLWGSDPGDDHYAPRLRLDSANPERSRALLKSGEVLPYVIFGQENKLSAELFMLDMLCYFQANLSLDTAVHVVGYGFGDEHINFILGRWRKRGGEMTVYDTRDTADFSQALMSAKGGVDIWSPSPLTPDVWVQGKTGAQEAFMRIAATLMS
jgi:hypothetical protein